MRRAPLTLLTIAALASCVPPPRPEAPPPIPRPTPPAPVAAPAPLAADWIDWPRTPGTWRYAPTPLGSAATFASAGTRVATLTCDARRRLVTLSVAAPAPGPLTIRTSSLTRQLAPAPTDDPLAGATIALPPADPLLDAIAFSRGRFTLEQAGRPPLVLPPHAEIDRLVEDCRG